MREKTISFLLLVIAAIHFVPVSGFAGVAQLESLYGIGVTSPELEILMRHRAVLFGILGGVFVLGAFNIRYQCLAFVLAASTLLPFFYLTAVIDYSNESIRGILLGDMIALVALLGAIILRYLPHLSARYTS